MEITPGLMQQIKDVGLTKPKTKHTIEMGVGNLLALRDEGLTISDETVHSLKQIPSGSVEVQIDFSNIGIRMKASDIKVGSTVSFHTGPKKYKLCQNLAPLDYKGEVRREYGAIILMPLDDVRGPMISYNEELILHDET